MYLCLTTDSPNTQTKTHKNERKNKIVIISRNFNIPLTRFLKQAGKEKSLRINEPDLTSIDTPSSKRTHISRTP